MGSIVLTLDNKMQIVCNDFNHSRKEKLRLLIWIPSENKWFKMYAKNKYTEIIWDYHRKHQKKRNKHINYESMMKHNNLVHKHSGGGTRIHNNSITDYECSSNPLHDFRRYYN